MDDGIADIYDRYWREGVGGWHVTASLSPPAAAALRRICTGKRILDFGGGDGERYGALVRTVASDYTVADVSLAVLDARRELGEACITPADLFAGGQQFEVALVLEVLEHVLDPLALLKQVANHVAPAGILLVSVPNAFNATNRLRMLSGRMPSSGVGGQGVRGRTYLAPHVKFFDVESLLDLVNAASLTALSAFTDRIDLWRASDLMPPRSMAYVPGWRRWVFELLANTIYVECARPVPDAP